MATIVYPPKLGENYEVYRPITTQEQFQVTTVESLEPTVITEPVIIVDGRTVNVVAKTLLRYQTLKRYRVVSGAVSSLWLFASLAALVLRSSPEPFFALFFSTFGLYLVFAMKCREQE